MSPADPATELLNGAIDFLDKLAGRPAGGLPATLLKAAAPAIVQAVSGALSGIPTEDARAAMEERLLIVYRESLAVSS